ncbi:MAG: histidine--tRNA ligase [Candidatus Nomurabacteria bacterium]|jgi:histidyl-tRNA synthetase|nr:histidine--tRNA ligase [Candidatus Nomurabacteria bacterium]
MITLDKNSYKGTRDFYPEDLRVRKYIFAKWSEMLESFGFDEYATPLLEPLNIFAAKSGEEIVNEQTYSFEDRGGRRLAIRPEMTPSVSRLIAARRQELAYPARLYSIANFMRYERAQRGREREFWQVNADVFGDDSIYADAEIVYLADKSLRKFGADKSMFEIRINDRHLIDFIMKEYLGLDDGKTRSLMKLLDKINKISDADFNRQAEIIFGQATGSILPRVRSLVDAKTLDMIPQKVQDSAEFKRVLDLFVLLEELGVETAIFDITLMRGLDYYTGVVFEVFDLDKNNNRSMFGGGRYDGLVGLFGVEPIGAVGFAVGYTTTELFLQNHKLLPKFKNETDIYIALVDQNCFKAAFELAEKLRGEGRPIELDSRDVKLDKKFKTAEKKGIGKMIIFGETEAKSGEYEIKELSKSKP